MKIFFIMICIIKILNNTFLGTLLAGTILALFGFYLYRKQKKTDIEYEDLRKTREQASLLLANIEIAFKKYEEQLGIYNGKNVQLSVISKLLNNKFNNQFHNKFVEEFNNLVFKIGEMNENLIAQLKIEGNHDADIKILTEKISIFNLFLQSVSVLHISKPEDIEQYHNGISETLALIRVTLQKLIKLK